MSRTTGRVQTYSIYEWYKNTRYVMRCHMFQGFYKVDDVYMDMSQSPYFYMSGKHRLLLQDIQYNRVLATIEAEFDIRFVPKVAS